MKKTLFLILILLVSCAPAQNNQLNEHVENEHTEMENDHEHEMLLNTYGPGLGPQAHKLSLKQFDKIEDISKSPNEIPSNAPEGETVKITLVAKEVASEIAPGVTYLYWTFNETVPGPMLRVREGQTVELTLINDKTSAHNHSIDLHAVNGPGGGAGLTEVAPGENKTFTFKALNPGLYVYHCATPNVPTHMTNGMYGLILVEPKEGMTQVDKEFYVMQGELYTKGPTGEKGYQAFSGTKMLQEKPDYVVFNGRINALKDHSLNARTNEKIRLYVGNGGVSLTSNFHVIGEIFDRVYPEASTNPHENVQTTIVPAGGATIVEFKTDVPGNYVLVDHALARLDKGAWGILTVEGPENKTIFAPK